MTRNCFAAVLTGLGALVGAAAPLSASVVYSQNIPPITTTGTLPFRISTLALDFNGDGNTDLFLKYTDDELAGHFLGIELDANANPLSPIASRVVGIDVSNAKALPVGAVVGPGDAFATDAHITGPINSGNDPNWYTAQTTYLGVRFGDSAGAIHYGWVELAAPGGASLFNPPVATGFAYETTPDQPIVTGVPEPAACGMLLLVGLLARRRVCPTSR